MNFGGILWWVWGRFLFRKALRFTSRGNYRKALLICEGLMRWFPHAPRVHVQLGFLYNEFNLPEISIFHSKKAICFLKKEWFEPWMNLGIGFIHAKFPIGAIGAFDKAEQLKDQVGMVQYGKLLLFRAEARRDIMRLYGLNDECMSKALDDLTRGEHIFRECDSENETAKFWFKQVPERRHELETMVR